MKSSRDSTIRNSIECLENRENPSNLFSDQFDSVAAPNIPTGWTDWSNNGDRQFITSRLQAASGPNALASTGARTTEARIWANSSFAADFGAAVSIRSDTIAPLELMTRGQNLNTTRPSYLAAVLRQGGQLELVEEVNGVRVVLGKLRPAVALPATWLRLELRPNGNQAAVLVKRADTGQYLNASGGWQANATSALAVAVTHRPTEGLVGLGRDTGGSGMAYFDDFAVLLPPALRESFDTTAPGVLPANWQQWTNDGTVRASVNPGRSLSPINGLSIDGGSTTRARAWSIQPMPADSLASVTVLADSLIPSGVIVRGANLNSNTPTYYSLTVSRGLTAQLKRVINGAETTLATVKSSTYISGPWVKLSLVATGNQLRALVYRTDTRQWLAADGRWQDTPEAAIERADGEILAAGLVGVERVRLSVGQVWLDDFEAKPVVTNAGPEISITASRPGNTFGQSVTFTATVNPQNVARIEFRLNGRLRSSQAQSPASWELDTRSLTNGTHTLAVRAIDEDGASSTKTITFEVFNEGTVGKPPRPTGVRKYQHIRLAQLAYSGNPMGQYERELAKNSLDLIVPNAVYLNTLEGAAPDTPKVIYTNVSNLYGRLLTDWFAFADRTNASRESAFFHVTQPTAFSGASPSAVPVNQFWGVFRGAVNGETLTDLTAESWGNRPTGVEFGGAGETMAIGWTDRFREINISLNRAATGWAGNLEYVSELNTDGTPKTWKTLNLLADGTNRFTVNGQLTFDPPADWKAAKLAGTQQHLYYVRTVTTAGTGPNAKSMLGRDYVNAAGRAQGVIPTFDTTADRNNDGYLNDAEYANRKSGSDARFVHESRLFYPYYGQMRFVTNPAGSALQRWAVDYHTRMLAANPNADGFFIDNSNGKLPFAGTPVKESTVAFTDDLAVLVGAVTRALPGKWVVSNTAGSIAEGDPITAESTASFEEFALRPNEVNWSGLQDIASLVNRRLNTDAPSPYLILDSHPGSLGMASERTRMGTLAYYYLMADPVKTFLMFSGGYSPASPWEKVFVPAATTDVGQPTSSLSTFATGQDPQNAALSYKVFSRDYGNAKMLFKPRSYTAGVGTGTNADATATLHDLGGNYRVLNSNGTLGAVVTQISLRNGEGVVLMKA
jgi:hypothetical protein